MPTDSTLKRHAHLVDNMATALGIDLEEHMMRGRLSFSGLEDAVLSCTNCTQPGACEAWLAAREGTAPGAPDYCRNTQLFDCLRTT